MLLSMRARDHWDVGFPGARLTFQRDQTAHRAGRGASSPWSRAPSPPDLYSDLEA